MGQDTGTTRLPVEGHLPPFDGATGWLHSEPLTPAGLRGKVVAVDFGTYTCINWIRTLPYVRAWAEAYGDDGLVVIGIHTPEFTVEHDIDRIHRSLKEMGITFPVAVDNDYAIWQAFSNRYWPALYIADAEGRIRHHWFGEGDYQRSEQVIRGLLADTGAPTLDRAPVAVEPTGTELAADWGQVQTPETYVGYRQARNFASGRVAPDQRQDYAIPDELGLNTWALAGEWTVHGEPAASNAANGRLAFRFHARDLNLVMGPGGRGEPAPFRVTLDGQPPGDAAGEDVDAAGQGLLDDPRMYQLIRQPGRIGPRTFEITFPEPGAEAFVFTFG